MVTLDLTGSGGSAQTSGEIAYNADATGGRTSMQGILEVGMGSVQFLLCVASSATRAPVSRICLTAMTFLPWVASFH